MIIIFISYVRAPVVSKSSERKLALHELGFDLFIKYTAHSVDTKQMKGLLHWPNFCRN